MIQGLLDRMDAHIRGIDNIDWREYTPVQQAFMNSQAKRILIKGGRRGGKTVGMAGMAVRWFLNNKKVILGAPTSDQIFSFWDEVKHLMQQPIADKLVRKNESRHLISRDGSTRASIRARTVWSPDDLRGQACDLLLLDEWQLQSEEVFEKVGGPMLLDSDGTCVFSFTIPSLLSRSTSKANDKLHAIKTWRQFTRKPHPDWDLHSFTSMDNKYIKKEAIERLRDSMSEISFRQEIMAEDMEEIPGALWTMRRIADNRIEAAPDLGTLNRVVIGVDPPGTLTTECGVVVAGKDANGHIYVLEDATMSGSPAQWAQRVAAMYAKYSADRVYAEKNYGGLMVNDVLRNADSSMAVSMVTATRGKAVRAEPIAAEYERGRVSHCGTFPELEEEMTSYIGDSRQRSPNRLDGLVWSISGLLKQKKTVTWTVL